MPVSGLDALFVHATLAMLVALPTAAATAQNSGPPVVVATAERREVIEQVPISGTVRSPRVARLSTTVAGRVDEVLVDGGDRVDANALLLKLDAVLARLAVDAAAAATARAREELADSRRRLAEVQPLVKTLGIAETEVRERESKVRLDSATVRLRETEQSSEAERLRRHELAAPFAGVIARKLTEVGEWVTPGDTVLELIADSDLRIDFRVPQDYFPRVTRETVTEVRIDALGGRPLPARISAIVPISDPSARTFVIRVSLIGENLPLTPGMSASGTLQLGTGELEVVVSRDALLRHADGRITAWVVEDSGATTSVTERAVVPGLAFEGQVAILSGLSPGARVVVEGNESLQQGQQVVIRGER